METFVYHNINWQGSPELVKASLALPFEKTVKQNRMRKVYFTAASENAVPQYFIKETKPERGFRKIKSLLRNKSKQEFESFQLLRAKNIPVVDYIAWGEKGQNSFLITKALSDHQEMADYFNHLPYTQEVEVYYTIADLIIQMVEQDIFHPDFHFGNIMVKTVDQKPQLCLLDVYGVVEKKMTTKQKLFMFSVLISAISSLSFKDRIIILRKISNTLSLAFNAFFTLHINELKRTNRLFLRKRIGKLFKSSSFIDIHLRETGDYFCYNKAPYDVDFFEKALVNHKQVIETENREKGWLKTDKKRRVSRFRIGEKSVVVKEFVAPGKLGRFAADARSWAGHFGTVQYNIPATTYHAWLKTDDGRAYIFMQDLGDLSYTRALENALAENNPSEQKRLVDGLARLMGNLHNLGVYHRDLKTDNFMINQGTLKLIDLDDITYGKEVNNRRRIKNFQQVYNTLPTNTTQRVKLGLLANYRRYTRISRQTIRLMAVAIDLKEESI